MNSRHNQIIALLVVIAIVLGLWFFLKNKPIDGTTSSPNATPTPVQMSDKRALDVLATIKASDDDERTKYDRIKFFGDFTDLTGDGCDSRQKAYKRDMTNVKMDPKAKCKVLSATLPVDPYLMSSTIEKDGKQVPITYTLGNGSDVDIDHRVTLEDAWKHGLGTDAKTDSEQQKLRQQFANDPYNLVTVTSKANRQKSYRTIDEWEAMGNKTSKSGKKTEVLIAEEAKPLYVAYIVGIKSKYNLSMTKAEHDRIEQILKAHPDQMVPLDTKSWK